MNYLAHFSLQFSKKDNLTESFQSFGKYFVFEIITDQTLCTIFLTHRQPTCPYQSHLLYGFQTNRKIIFVYIFGIFFHVWRRIAHVLCATQVTFASSPYSILVCMRLCLGYSSSCSRKLLSCIKHQPQWCKFRRKTFGTIQPTFICFGF